MEAILYQRGDVIDWTATAAVSEGDIVMIGSIPMVAVDDIALAAVGGLACEGVFECKKDSSTFAAGDAAYWNPTGTPVGGTATGAMTSTASGAYLAGVVTEEAATGATTVKVKWTAAMRTVAIAGSMTADDITGSDSTLTITGLAGSGTNNGGTVAAVAGASGSGATGNGGAASLTGGAAASTNGVGGAASVVGGIGKGTQAGGAVAVTGGVGGATGAGGAAALTGGAGGSSSGTGGAASLAGGAGTAGNANGGAASLLGGNAHGSGTDGVVNVGTSNTSQVNLAAASIPTVIAGPVNRTAGASTAAAGSTTADAGALPAATACVYPTTAADDTKGVVVHANDKVTGRTIWIGNGVSNKILKVYPPSGGTINGGSADAAFSSASGKGVMLHCLDSATNAWLGW